MSKVQFTMTTRAEEFLDEYDYRDFLRIDKDGKEIFRVSDGEPEDSNLSRDFNDCHNILALMEQAYELGKAGVEVDFDYDEDEC